MNPYVSDLPYPADYRETMRAKLEALPRAARAVYNRENIRNPKTKLLVVVETVLYNFDATNRARVAEMLSMSHQDLLTLLTGYILSREVK